MIPTEIFYVKVPGKSLIYHIMIIQNKFKADELEF